jgi:serine/threonine protein kinase
VLVTEDGRPKLIDFGIAASETLVADEESMAIAYTLTGSQNSSYMGIARLVKR